MFEDGLDKVLSGVTTVEELLRVAAPPALALVNVASVVSPATPSRETPQDVFRSDSHVTSSEQASRAGEKNDSHSPNLLYGKHHD